MIVASLIATIRRDDMSTESLESQLEEDDFEDSHANEATQYLMGG
jgi:hypothetical protein